MTFCSLLAHMSACALSPCLCLFSLTGPEVKDLRRWGGGWGHHGWCARPRCSSLHFSLCWMCKAMVVFGEPQPWITDIASVPRRYGK